MEDKNLLKVITGRALFIVISLLFINCISLVPLAIEDRDEGTVLIIESSIVLKVVENWGLENGFKYVAYRRLPDGTRTPGEWIATEHGALAGSTKQYTSRVLVIGIDNPKSAPERFNVATVPPKKNQEIAGGYFVLPFILVLPFLPFLLFLLL